MGSVPAPREAFGEDWLLSGVASASHRHGRRAPLQAAVAEQRKYQQRGGPRRQAKGDHSRSLLCAADKVLITVLYLRQVCPQKVLSDLLSVNPASIGHAIAETRKVLYEQRISDVLTHPKLTGMSHEDFHALLTKISVSYAATVEKRRHLRRGADRLPGTRGGVFRQKVTDADRILATILSQRRLCSQDTLAELFGVSRGTLRNAYDDVLPLLEEHGFII
jgi:hypothetical protein